MGEDIWQEKEGKEGESKEVVNLITAEMLVQWRYKVCEWFATCGDSIVTGEHLKQFRGGKVRPQGIQIYKPSKRRYDYVDYTGTHKRQEVPVDEITCYLEILGYIRFVEVDNGKSGVVGQD